MFLFKLQQTDGKSNILQQTLCMVLSKESLLFVTAYKTIRVYCPFEVVCIKAVRDIAKGTKVKVEQVEDWDNTTILYQINNKLYPHQNFRYIPPTRLVITRLK